MQIAARAAFISMVAVGCAGLRKDSRHFVIALTPGLQSVVSVTGFRAGEQEQAMKAYLDAEKRVLELPGAEAVMVSARSIDDGVRGYPSYFIDTKRFLEALRVETAG